MKKEYRVYLAGADYSAEGKYHLGSNEITVLKGSKIKEVENSSFRKYYPNVAEIKDDLIKEKIIIDNEFIQDYKFNHVFHASVIVSTYGKTGGEPWKLKDGKTIQALEQMHKNINTFITYFQDTSVPKLKEIHKEKEETISMFQQLFPLEKLDELTLEDYDTRGSKESLAYMIEYGTNEIFDGFLGSNRNKIFYQQKDDSFDCVQVVKNMFPGKSIKDLFEHYLNGIYNLVKNFNKKTYSKEAIDGLPGNTNTIRGKLLMLYHPNELLNFNSKSSFNTLFEFLGLNPSNKDSIMMNIELQQFLVENGITINNTETSEILWGFYHEYLFEPKDTPPDDPTTFDEIFLEEEYITKMIRILKRKKALILKGVPGVGKTFVIKDIIGNSFENIGENGIEMIQFHQSYSYEEFIEGLKPQMGGSFDVEKGLFYDIAKKAEDDPENNYFLIIDEINRGNISKIFGELMMLIENDKRDDHVVKLSYSKEPFTVPGNLYVIGTMNTADRSLTFVDYALRRRFSFMTIEPAFGTRKFNAFLQNKMSLKDSEINQINHVMIEVNELITMRLGKDFVIGHSYFISNEESIGDFSIWYDDVVTYEIMPMIEEYFFEDDNIVQTIHRILVGYNE